MAKLKILYINVLVLLCCSFYENSAISSQLPLTVSAESAIMINAETGAVLYEKKPHAKLFPASVTKIATAAYALELKGSDLSELMVADQDCIGSVTEEAKQRANYTLPSYWLVTDCSHIRIKKGEALTLKDLLYGMMVASADDASNIVAQKLGNGSIPNFMEKLNDYVKSLGCKDTYFNNPHGLHHPKHVTTAYDMALITKQALKNPQFREMVSTSRYTRPKTNKQESTILVQTNKLLRAGEYYYPRAIGVKTGRTSKAGNTFVAAATEGDRTLIVVLLNVKDRKDIFKDAIRLFDAAFNQLKIEKTVIRSGSQPHGYEIEGAEKLVQTYTLEDVTIAYYPAEEPKIKAYLQWDKLELPIKKGQRVGELHLKDAGQSVIKTVPLYAHENVDAEWSYKIKQFFAGKGLRIFMLAGVVIVILAGIYFVVRSGSRS